MFKILAVKKNKNLLTCTRKLKPYNISFCEVYLPGIEYSFYLFNKHVLGRYNMLGTFNLFRRNF